MAWVQQQDLAAAEAYWRATLGGFTHAPGAGSACADHARRRPVHPLPINLQLDPATSRALQELARREHLTLEHGDAGEPGRCFSAATLGQTDIVFGATVTGRPAALPRIEERIGPFINTLPVRVNTAPEQTLLPWLAALQAEQAEARRYDYSPLVQVQGWSDVPRGTALFESLLVFENYPLDAAAEEPIPGITLTLAATTEETNYPLTVTVMPGNPLEIQLTYDARRFTAAAIQRLGAHFVTLLAGAGPAPIPIHAWPTSRCCRLRNGSRCCTPGTLRLWRMRRVCSRIW